MNYALLYIILTAISAVLRQIGAHKVSPALLLFAGGILAMIFFNVVNTSKLKQIYLSCFRNKKDWLAMSISIAVTWTCAIYSPGYIGASLYTFLYFSTLGTVGILALNLKNNTLNKVQLISVGGTILLLAFMAIKYIVIIHTFKETLGVGLAFLGGFSAYIYAVQSAKFMKKASLSASQTLAVRFYFLIVLSFFLLPLHNMTNFNSTSVSVIFLITLFSFILPIYCVQKSIHNIGPDLNAIIISTTPFFTAILEQLYFHDVAPSNFIVYATYLIFATLPYLAKRYSRIMD